MSDVCLLWLVRGEAEADFPVAWGAAVAAAEERISCRPFGGAAICPPPLAPAPSRVYHVLRNEGCDWWVVIGEVGLVVCQLPAPAL